MKQNIRRILVAVKELGGRASPAIRKAATLARATGAEIELFHAISEPLAVDALMFAGETVRNAEEAGRKRCVKRLERLAVPLRRTGLAVTVRADWDYPAHAAVVRRALHARADLVVAERHESRHVAPWVLRYNDWELLRHCPVPVLLVKSRRRYESPAVLAAIDPAHAFSKTASLDHAILRNALQVATTLRGALHVVHAFVPSLTDATPAELTAPDAPARIVGHAAAAASTRLDKALRTADLAQLPKTRRHLVARHPVDAIPQLVKRHGIDVVVMGLARSGIKGLFIGNTAERLLDDLACDLLVVKTPGFVTRVPKKPRGPLLISIGPPYGVV